MAFFTQLLASIAATDDPPPEIVELRERLLRTLLLTFTALAILPVSFGSYLAVESGQLFFALLYPSLFLLLPLCALMTRRLSYRLRGGALLLFGMGIGIADIFRIGLSGVGLETVTAFTVIGTILFGVRIGLLLQGLTIVSIALAGAGFLMGLMQPEPGLFLTSHSGMAWITAGILFAAFTFVLNLSPEILRRRLQQSLREEELKTHDLGQTVGKLEDEVLARTEAEEALGESERRFRNLAELLPETVFETDLGARLTFVNETGYQKFGYSEAEMLEGLTAFDLLDPSEHDRARVSIENVMRNVNLGIREYRARRKDGSTLPVLIRSAPIHRDGKLKGMRGILIDISEKKRVEDHLFQAQKMEAVGTLAGGMAHDFNNLLMGIQGRVSILLNRKDTSGATLEHLSIIEEHIQSAADLTRQLLGLARGGKYELTTTDLNELVRKTLEMFVRTHKELSTDLALHEGLWTAQVDRHQIEQVLLNLLLNAWQAMGDGGQLRVETENLAVDAAHSADLDLSPGDFVRISVSDTGTGMDEETLARIFEPFFTTKEQGRGTGLGLASAYGIAKNHGGALVAESVPRRGSTFRIYLPAQPEGTPAEVAAITDDLPSGTETILLVDDEALILSATRPLLELLGYTVLTANAGHRAIEIIESDPAAVDLIILDMVMPGLDGVATFDRLQHTNSNAKVLLSSGYSVDRAAAKLLERGCSFLQKPYTLQQLARKLRELLD